MARKNKKKTDDDILDDMDLEDIEDLEEIEDLEDFDEDGDFEGDLDNGDDDSWDGLDDGDMDDMDGMEDVEDAAMASPSKSGVGGSFLQKNFKLIVIGVVVLAGGLVALGQMNKNPVPSPQQPGLEPKDAIMAGMQDDMLPDVDAPAGQDPDMPPMPAPVETTDAGDDAMTAPAEGSPDAFLAENGLAPEEPQVPTLEDDGVLTPMPAAAGMEEPLQGLEDLDALMNDKPAMDDKTQTSSEMPDMTETAMDKMDETPPGSMDLPGMLPPTAQQPTRESQPVTKNLDAFVEPGMTEQQKLEGRILEMEAQMEALKTKNKTLIAENAQKQRAADDISRKLAAAEKKNAELANENSALKSAAARRTSESAPMTSTPETSRPARPAASPSPSRTTSYTPPKWVLRSAQPGQAVLASADKGDLRTVETGDTVPGLGRIRSIALENGHWVVQGTIGSVSR